MLYCLCLLVIFFLEEQDSLTDFSWAAAINMAHELASELIFFKVHDLCINDIYQMHDA